MFYVGIDLGTYLCRFILAKKSEDNNFLNFETVNYTTSIVDFGNVKPGIKLSVNAIKRLDKAFKDFNKLIPNNVKIRCVATAALRYYDERNEIVDSIYKNHNIEIEVIEAHEEIKLTATACKKLIKDKAIIIDFGSGSTEVALVSIKNNKIKVHETALLDLGLSNNLTDAVRRKSELAKLDILISHAKNVPIICAKCSILKITYLHLFPQIGMDVNGVELEISDIKNVLAKFCKMKMKDLQKIKLIGNYRSSLVKLGLPWIFKVLEGLQGKTTILCEYGLKEGIILDIMEEEI